MDNSFPEINWPKELKPESAEFLSRTTEINFLPITDEGLRLQTDAFWEQDQERVRQAGFEEMNDLKYGLRDLKRDVADCVRLSLTATTMGLYNRFFRVERNEDLKNAELAMPVGGCVILLTREKDGSQRLVLLFRKKKNEYQSTPGATAGGIISIFFDDDGKPLPIESVYRKHIEERLREEVGIDGDKYNLKISGVITEKAPKAHHEIASMAETSLSYEELCRSCIEIKRDERGAENLISLPASIETIEMLASRLDCPLPPSHLAALLSVGYMMVMRERGCEEAQKWLRTLEPLVDKNADRIDQMVVASGRGTSYMPYQTPEEQGLANFIEALYRLKLLVPKDDALVEKENSPERAAVTGSVHFPRYGEDISDTARGDQALRGIEKVLRAGYGVIVVVTAKTNEVYRQKLKSLASAGKLFLLEEESLPDADAHSYGVSRRQAIAESVRRGFDFVLSVELEKEDLLDPENLKKLIAPLAGGDVGMVTMSRRGMMEKDRDIEENRSGLPEAQYFGEFSQNYYIWKMWRDSGFTVPDEPYDLLNGTRLFANLVRQISVEGREYEIRPSDLAELRYEYDNEAELQFPYKVDHYAAPIYHSVTLLMALAGESAFASVEIDYQHPRRQTLIEESPRFREEFEKKRLNQKIAIVLQTFDLCANILRWREEGVWPEIVLEAIRDKKPLRLRHYDIRTWKIEEGRLIERVGVKNPLIAEGV